MKGLCKFGGIALGILALVAASASAGERTRGQSSAAGKAAQATTGRTGIAKVVFMSKGAPAGAPVVKPTFRAKMIAIPKGNQGVTPGAVRPTFRARVIYAPNGKSDSTQVNLTNDVQLTRSDRSAGQTE